MAKLSLTNLANLQNETTVVTAINANNDATETAMENTLSRDGTSPNSMNANLDMNSFRIINLSPALSNNEPLTLGQALQNAGLPNVANILYLNVGDQQLAGGANVTTLDLGTKSSGTLTIDCGSRPLQRVINNGAFTLAAPASDGSCLVLVTNGASAGTITFFGFTTGVSTGDALNTTNTNKFTITIWRINGVSGYRISAHQ